MESCFAAFSFHATGGEVCLVRNGDPELLQLSNLPQNQEISIEGAELNLETSVIGGMGDHRMPVVFVPPLMYILKRQEMSGSPSYAHGIRDGVPDIDDFLVSFENLMEEEKVGVARHLEDAFIAFLDQFQHAAQEKAVGNWCKITKLVATFPSTWNAWTQKYFLACVKIAWKLPWRNIILMHESEAIVHLIFSRMNMLRPQHTKPGKIILVDLGRYTLNISSIYIESPHTNPRKFHLLTKCNDIFVLVAVHSGMRLHERLVEAKVRRYIEASRDQIPEYRRKEIYAQFMASYQETCRVVVGGSAFTILATASSGGVVHEIPFHAEEALRITGSMALGAAAAVLDAATVTEFMQTACFGIRGMEDDDSSPSIVWRSGSSVKARISILDSEDLARYVICCPAPQEAGTTSIKTAASYEVFRLPQLSRGDYEFHMTFEESDDGDYSVLIHYSRANDGRSGQAICGTFKYSFYYDVGACVCFEDTEDTEDTQKPSREWESDGQFDEPDELAAVTSEELEAEILAWTNWRSAHSQRED
ncbi:hypothetical protein PWT90_10212 [Aphanocladium album]|nr:hypothetical protein PWT90_10212 [Aphanocladium album]